MGPLLTAVANEKSRSGREDLLLGYVKDGLAEWSWGAIYHREGDDEILLTVMNDCIKIEGVRIDVSATLMQRIADVLDCTLPTAKMWDILWLGSDVKLAPVTRPITSSVSAMVEQSAAIDRAIDGRTGIVANAGKTWALSNKLAYAGGGCGVGSTVKIPYPNVAANYGWFVKSGSSAAVSNNLRVIQPLSRCHDRFHTDYSQLCQLFGNYCVLNNEPTTIVDVLTGPRASLISSEGKMTVLRQPGVVPDGGSSGPGGPVAFEGSPTVPASATDGNISGDTASSPEPSAPKAESRLGRQIAVTAGLAFVAAVSTALAYKLISPNSPGGQL